MLGARRRHLRIRPSPIAAAVTTTESALHFEKYGAPRRVGLRPTAESFTLYDEIRISRDAPRPPVPNGLLRTPSRGVSSLSFGSRYCFSVRTEPTFEHEHRAEDPNPPARRTDPQTSPIRSQEETLCVTPKCPPTPARTTQRPDCRARAQPSVSTR